MALSLLVSAWLVGTLGGLHCVTMCGGFVAAMVARDAAGDGRASVPLLPARALMWRQGVYHGARVTTYTLLGAAFGAAGATALDAAALLPLQRALYVLANLFLFVLGLSLAFGGIGVAWLQRAGAAAFARALPALRPLLARPGAGGRVALGIVWGLVPCALVYSMLPLALFAGGAWQGALVMAAFGAGTVPNLFVMSAVLGRARPWLSGRTLRYAAAALLVGFAIAGVYRVLFLPDTLARGAFCLVS